MNHTEQLRHFIGLDLGQANDFSAIAVLERPVRTLQDPPHSWKPPYALRYLHRFPLGTPYPEVVRSVSDLLHSPQMADPMLVIDQTGVGRPVVEMLAGPLADLYYRPLPVTITGGHTATTAEDGSVRVPKKELVSAVQVVLQTRRLRISSLLPESSLLVQELQNFRVKITDSMNETFSAWRENQHDDLVLAAALAVWFGELALPKAGDMDDSETTITVVRA